MAHGGFVHLSIRTAYSLAEGAIHIADLAGWARENAMPAAAITDTNNLFGALEFSETLRAAGIQPIIGCTLSLRTPYFKPGRDLKPPPQHPVRLLAASEAGYRNLIKLVSRAHLESGPAEPPHATLEGLKGLTEGLILLSGGPSGPLGALVRENRLADAGKLARDFTALFPERAYVELMRHGMEQEKETEEPFVDLAYRLGLPLVAGNDAHFIGEEMYPAHDALLCIADGAYVAESDRRKLTPDHRLKTAEEMVELFADLPEAVENTLNIARRCSFAPEAREPVLPKFSKDEGVSEAELLRKEAEKGLEQRLETHVFSANDDAKAREQKAAPYRERLAFELDVITGMGYPGYFLIVADFIQWAKDNGVPVGPGRGSGAGSVVAWALRITELDPLRFGLLFERFLNPERVSMPDFDIDFCQEKRDRVIHYVQEKYGENNVAQIITFGTLNARAVMRDVGRVLQQPYPVTDRLCKMIPNNPADPVTLSQAIADEPRLQYERDNDEVTKAVIDLALKLEGLYRHASTHAAGVVIGDRPLDEVIPLYRDPRSQTPVTGFSMKWVEKAGLVKFDFLGLKTLTVLARAIGFLKEREIDVTLEEVPLDDPRTYQILSRGDTAGVFQLEGSGMRTALKALKPDKFEDIIAMVALYRPGPMDNIPTYINRKHGREQVEYLHEWLEPVLAETYGVIIYQEQVMEIAKILAGYSLGEADLLRRAMGKKIKEEMDAQRKRFVGGAAEKGVAQAKASFIFELVAKFAGYGFNKSHAAAYALVAYHTAYFKANYPVEFMAATMSLETHNTDKLASLVKEVKAMEIPLLSPDINKSQANFSVEKLGENQRGVRYALSAIKNVGAKAMAALVEEREKNGPYQDLFDLMERLDPEQMNKRQFENLACAGALDSLNANRAQTLAALDSLLRHAHACYEARESSQVSLFSGEGGSPLPRFKLPGAEPWDQAELLKREREALGFYFTAHPLEPYQEMLRGRGVVPSSEIFAEGRHVGSTVRIAGMVEDLQIRKAAKSGNPFGFLALSDGAGSFEALVFSDLLDDARAVAEEDQPVIAQVSVDQNDRDAAPRVVVRALEPFDPDRLAEDVELRVEITAEQALAALKDLLAAHEGGKGQVSLSFASPGEGREVIVRLPGGVRISPALQAAVSGLEGVGAARFLNRRAS